MLTISKSIAILNDADGVTELLNASKPPFMLKIKIADSEWNQYETQDMIKEIFLFHVCNTDIYASTTTTTTKKSLLML